MKNFIIKTLLTAAVVLLIAYFLPNIKITGLPAVLVFAVVLSLLNTFVKPIIKILTFPITLLTFGLFLLVINVIVIYLADHLVDDFEIVGTTTLLLFTFLLSLGTYVLDIFVKK